jgi:HSP20 family protein
MFKTMSDIDRMLGAIDLLHNKRDQVFSDFNRSFGHGPGLTFRSSAPRTNFYENGDTFEIQAEIPGIAKEDLNISIQGNYLEISGSRSADTPEGYKVHRSESGASTFSKRFTLPDEVDAQKVEANLKDGILYLKLPKSETAKPRQIEIKAA